MDSSRGKLDCFALAKTASIKDDLPAPEGAETKKSLGSLITLNFEPAHAAPLLLTSWLVLNLLNQVFLFSLIVYSPL